MVALVYSTNCRDGEQTTTDPWIGSSHLSYLILPRLYAIWLGKCEDIGTNAAFKAVLNRFRCEEGDRWLVTFEHEVFGCQC
jgi:hypothetical protein